LNVYGFHFNCENNGITSIDCKCKLDIKA